MLFSFKEFEQTKNSLIKQFEQQPCIEIQASDPTQLIYEYNKILNQIKYARTNKKDGSRFQLTSARTERNTLGMPKSATYRELHKMANVTTADDLAKREETKKRFRQTNNCNKFGVNTYEGDFLENFYLTGLSSVRGESVAKQTYFSQTMEMQDSSNLAKTSFKIEAIQLNEQVQVVQNNQQKLDKNLQQIVDLRVKIFEFLKHEQYLNAQISQIQQSIRYYRGLNNELQSKIEQKKKKHIIALNSVLKKQSDLNAVGSRNKYIKQKFEDTQRFFAKSLKSIKINRNSESKKCSEMIDEVTEKMLTAKYLKSKIDSQRQQIRKLEEKNKYKHSRIEESKKMHIYAKILLQVQKVVDFIRNNQYGSVEHLEAINKEILFTRNTKGRTPVAANFGTIKNISLITNRSLGQTNSSQLNNNNNNNNNNNTNDKQFQQTNFLKLTKQLLRTHTKLCSDEQRLKQSYEYKINQLQTYRKTLYTYNSQNNKTDIIQTNEDTINHKKILQVSTYSKQFKQQMEMFQSGIKKQSKVKAQLGGKYKKWNYVEKLAEKVELEQATCKQEQKLRKINDALLSIEDRSKFFVRKQIKYLQNIVQRWLKFDQSAINFLIDIINRFIKIEARTKEQLSFSQSRDILKDHFENWENYLFFIQQIHSNPFLSGSLCKNKLKQKLKRIIKTKLTYCSVPTQKIMIKCLKEYHSERSDKNMQTIQILIKLGLEIYQYAAKYQVLIVNNCDYAADGPRGGGSAGALETKGNGENQCKQGTTNVEGNDRMNILQQMLGITQQKQNNVQGTKVMKGEYKSYLKSNTKPPIHAKASKKSKQNSQQNNYISSSLEDQTVTNVDNQLQESEVEEEDSAILMTPENEKQQEIPALVNLILAYQFQLNKIPKLLKGNVPRFLDAK